MYGYVLLYVDKKSLFLCDTYNITKNIHSVQCSKKKFIR